MLDYIIVGFGLSGLSFSEQLLKNNKSFVVISETDKSSSVVAGGMYNPVILKRFTSPWNAIPQLEYAIPFYQEIENRLNTHINNPLPVLRVFNTIEEQNNWLIASDKPNLAPFLSTIFKKNDNEFILANNDFGVVEKAGRIQVAKLLSAYKLELLKNDSYRNEVFDYDALKIADDFISYKGLKAQHIVFCEGFGLKSNPYFNYLPLNGTKGEVLIIKAESLKLNAIVKSGVFIIPIEEENRYLVGATYHWTDKTWKTTDEAKSELISKLNTVLSCDYEVVGQLAGIRPTVKDRRPLVGRHPEYKNMYVLNGLGTRGVMVAPTVSDQLLDYIEYKTVLDTEIDIQRFADEYIAS
ncbi:MAG: FAD-binding oxidoreductase [Flavobacteriaceae bacterium]|nr:FAD-binding oxidoreductase [Flavobacteriaceae bacterium]